MPARVSTGDRDAVLRQIRWCAAVQTLVNVVRRAIVITRTCAKKIEVINQVAQKLEWKQTDGQTDGRTRLNLLPSWLTWSEQLDISTKFRKHMKNGDPNRVKSRRLMKEVQRGRRPPS